MHGAVRGTCAVSSSGDWPTHLPGCTHNVGKIKCNLRMVDAVHKGQGHAGSTPATSTISCLSPGDQSRSTGALLCPALRASRGCQTRPSGLNNSRHFHHLQTHPFRPCAAFFIGKIAEIGLGPVKRVFGRFAEIFAAGKPPSPMNIMGPFPDKTKRKAWKAERLVSSRILT